METISYWNLHLSWDWSTIWLIQNNLADFLRPMSCLDRITFSVMYVQRLFVTWLIAWSTFFAKLKWHEVALVKMVTSQWFCVLKEHLLATDTTKSIPVFFVLSFTLHRDVTSFWTIREASLDTMKDSGRYSRSVTTEASVNNASMYLCLINNPSQCLSRNFKVDSVILSNNFVT